MDAAGGTAGMDAQTLKEFGNECFKKRDFAKAAECYSSAIDLRPEASLYPPLRIACEVGSSLTSPRIWASHPLFHQVH